MVLPNLCGLRVWGTEADHLRLDLKAQTLRKADRVREQGYTVELCCSVCPALQENTEVW